jgi:hypothetical protein
MSEDLQRLAADLDRAGATAGRQLRGITAKAVDAGAANARSQAEAKWTRSGMGTGDSAKSVRARMSTSEEAVGYIFVDGGGAFQETGTGHHPPNPVLPSALEVAAKVLESKMGEVGRL